MSNPTPTLEVTELPSGINQQITSKNVPTNVPANVPTNESPDSDKQVNIGTQIQTLLGAVNLAQKRGAYNLKEAVAIGNAVEELETALKKIN